MNRKKESNKQEVSIVLCGGAGLGIETVEKLLTGILKRSGYYVFATKEYMSRVRGGSNSTQIIISDKPIRAPLKKIDLLIALDNKAISHVAERISRDTMIISEEDDQKSQHESIHLSFSGLAKEIGQTIYANTIAVGFLLRLIRVDLREGRRVLKEYFSKKNKESFLKDNLLALEKGHQEAQKMIDAKRIKPSIMPNLDKSHDTKKHFLFNGAESIGLGAIAAGCNFVSSYPMSPSTGVLVFLAEHANQFNIVVEQAEDEIAAVNMAVGAWFTGARALVTTSGGGLALMTEGISLAGMTENPLVIHLAQRPGPATGLPTRTEQGDLQFVLNAGHGEFPRIVLSPGDIPEAYHLTQMAFHWADKFQIPVFILTDQYMMDSYYNIEKIRLTREKIKRYIVKTKVDYQRYSLKQNNPVSPRGIPGFGEGLIRVDSDEHDEEGLITEDHQVRAKMVEKRNSKLFLMKMECLPPVFYGPEDYRVLCIGWGSTFPIIQESVNRLNRKDVAILHFRQVYPISTKINPLLKRAKQILSIENNYSGQFSQLIERATGIHVDVRILKYNGFPFYSDELAEEIGRTIDQRGGFNEFQIII